MTGLEVAAIIGACGTFLTALGSFYSIIVSSRNSKSLTVIATKVDGVLAQRDAAKVSEGEQNVHSQQAAAREVIRTEGIADAKAAATVAAIESNGHKT